MTGQFLARACTIVATYLTAMTIVVSSAAAQLASGGPAFPQTQPARETLPAPQPRLPGELPPPAQPRGEPVIPPADFVEDVRILGNQSVPIGELQRQIKTRSDRPFDKEMVEEDVRRLISMRRFVTVDVSYQTGLKGGRVIIFRLVERPTLKYVKYVGNSIRDRSLDKQTNLKAGDAADPFMVTEAARKLEEYYHSKGFPNAKITVFEGDRPGDPGAVFLINEGQKQSIWKVDFVGNTIATDARLRTQIQSRTPILMLFKGEFDRAKVDEDVNKLVNYYRDLGYFFASIGREITVDPDGDWVTLTFVINEGPRYKIRNISIVGNTKIDTSELMSKLKLGMGDYFDKTIQDGDVRVLTDAYGSIGYVFALVEPAATLMEQPGEMDLVYRIEEGARYRIGRIDVTIEGENPRTRRNTVLNRVSLYPGQIADIRELRDSERRLKASGLFLNDPSQGAAPRVIFKDPTMPDEEVADRPQRSSPSRGAGGGGPRGGGVRGQSPDEDRILNVDVNGRLRPEVRRDVDEKLNKAEHLQQPTNYRAQSPVSGAQPTNYNYSGVNVGVGQVPLGRTGPDSLSGRMTGSVTGPGLNQLAQNSYPTSTYGAPATTYPSATSPATGYQPGSTYLPQNNPPAYGGVQSQFSQQPATPAYGPGAVQPNFAPPSYGQPQVAPGQLPPPGFGAPQPYAPPSGPGVTQGDLYDPRQTPFNPGEQYSDGYVEPTVPLNVDVRVRETQTGRIQLGVGVNSNAGVVGNVVVDEQNFDWRRIPTSWEDIRNGTAFRGGGQQFRVEAIPGTVVSRYSLVYRDPYFLDSPYSLSMSAFYFQRFYQDWTEGRAGGRIGLGRQLTPDLASSFYFRGENVQLSNPTVPTPQELQDALGNNGLYAFGLDLIHDTRDSTFMATEGHFIKLGFEQAIGSFSYPRGTFEGRQYFLLHQRPDRSGRHVLMLATDLGIAGTQTPIYENYFAGGIGSMRGFAFRGVTPLSGGVQIGGRFQWINSAEYQFPISADDMLRGAFFCDFGTVERSVKVNGESFRVALGAGLRITIPAMGPAPIALDLSAPVNNFDGDRVQNFSFNIGAMR
jgi:outer membrane protein insertion porin family